MTSRIIGFIVLGALLLAAGMPADQGSERALIDRFLTAWHRAAEKADEAAYFGAMADGFVFLGTDVKERWTREEFRVWAKPAFSRPSAWTFRALRRDIALAPGGKVAWFDEDLESASFWISRGSGVLIKTADGWKLAQYVLSLTIPNEAVKEIKPIVTKALAPKGVEEP